MSAQLIYDLAPLGSIVAWSDGTPRPPKYHCNLLSSWKCRNDLGQLVQKLGQTVVGDISLPPSISLLLFDYGQIGPATLRAVRPFWLPCDLKFTVIERPAIGTILVLDAPGEDAELIYTAPSRKKAQAWLRSHDHPDAVLQEVTADQVAADVVEGRMPA